MRSKYVLWSGLEGALQKRAVLKVLNTGIFNTNIYLYYSDPDFSVPDFLPIRIRTTEQNPYTKHCCLQAGERGTDLPQLYIDSGHLDALWGGGLAAGAHVLPPVQKGDDTQRRSRHVFRIRIRLIRIWIQPFLFPAWNFNNFLLKMEVWNYGSTWIARAFAHFLRHRSLFGYFWEFCTIAIYFRCSKA